MAPSQPPQIQDASRAVAQRTPLGIASEPAGFSDADEPVWIALRPSVPSLSLRGLMFQDRLHAKALPRGADSDRVFRRGQADDVACHSPCHPVRRISRLMSRISLGWAARDLAPRATVAEAGGAIGGSKPHRWRYGADVSDLGPIGLHVHQKMP